EGLENVETLSGFRDENFAKSYQTEIADGPLAGLESRAVVILDEKGMVIYTQQVPEIVDEPDYEAALAVLK
ncbi:Thiol peroxidase, Tpx-type, partial [hydrothermal vent metagenome]